MQRIETADSEFVLGYWAIRGLAQPIRFLLAYVGVPFSEVRLGVTQDGTVIEAESGEWDTHRATLDLPFPNLPYLIDSSGSEPVRVSQSNAVMRYLGRRFDLYGDCDEDRLIIDVLQEEAYDFRNRIVKAAYTLGDAYQAAYDDFVTVGVPRHLDAFERYLAARDMQTCFAGGRTSLVDFILYELLWQTRLMAPGSITQSTRPCLFDFIERFADQRRIAVYMESENYLSRPINSPWASFC